MPLVALDARLTRQMSVGMKAYVRELVARLPKQAPDLEFVIFSNQRLKPSGANARLQLLSEAVAESGAPGEQLVLPRLLARSGAQLFHYMSVYAPRFGPRSHVYTIHDLIHLRFPEYFSWKVPVYYRLVVGPVARGARAVITDARQTVDDLAQYLSVEREKTRVIPLGVAEAFALDDGLKAARAAGARARFGFDRPYFVYAGNHRPHKNVATLVDAWGRIDQPCDLVITEEGSFDFPLDMGPKTNGRIHLPGHVQLDDLVALYAGCAAVIQPSLYEGFGLSVLEAMACGAPVIVAQTPALVEVGGDAALSFPPTDVAALAAHMRSVMLDAAKAGELQAAGRERVRNFTWDATARGTAAVYREAMQT